MRASLLKAVSRLFAVALGLEWHKRQPAARSRKIFTPLLLGFVFFFAPLSHAAITFIGFGATPIVAVRVGQPAGISTVDVTVPGDQVGSGTPVVGTPPIFVGALAQAPFAFPFPVFTLSVDSSVPLTNGSADDSVYRD